MDLRISKDDPQMYGSTSRHDHFLDVEAVKEIDSEEKAMDLILKIFSLRY